MKRCLFLFALLVTGHILQAQAGSWKIKLRHKTLLATSKEDETKNERRISRSEWKRSGYFELVFTEAEPKTWYRHFLFVDEKDEVILSKDSTTTVKLPIATLRQLFKSKKIIKIYTYVSPVDPRMAVRVRRVHLFTMKLP